MRILVLGAGAVGLTVAAKLSEHAEVFAVCRERCVSAISENGFTMTGIWGEKNFALSVGTKPPAGPWDYIIISTKSAATRGICEEYADIFGDAEVVSLQNGIGNEEIIAEYTNNVIGAMIITGFEWVSDSEVHVSVDGGETVFGRFPAGVDERVEALTALFNTCGMRSLSSENIRGTVWGKAFYSCSLNPLGAVMECPYGELLQEPAWHIIEGIVREAFAVSAAEGVVLPQKTADEYLAFLKNQKIPPTAAHYSSMYQDIAAKRLTEVDFINGAVVQLGKKHGIETPVNETIVNLTHFKEGLKCR
ncbi:MAG: ketopantoate reductase family protein [Methanocorpusculum sp.]|nr:ketopantoate reductase family protein [Methanocorpusculum sp.]